MYSMVDSRFRVIREQVLRASREDLLRHTDLSLGTLRNVERNIPVRLTTAQQLLDAVNHLLDKAGKPLMVMEDLGLTLRDQREISELEAINPARRAPVDGK